jgi:regulatory protein
MPAQKNPLNYALYLLRQKDRSVADIEKRMARKGFNQEEIVDVVKKLKDKKLLDDERFVDNYIRAKQEFCLTGKYKLKMKLLQNGVDKELIEEKLSNIISDDELNRATELAQNWLIKKQLIPQEKKYEKLGRFLIGKGYEIDIVKKVLGEILHK